MTVHASPDYRMHVEMPAPAGYPTRRVDDEFSSQPFEADYSARRKAFLEHCARNPAPLNTKATYYELARMAAGEAAHEGVIQAALDYIDQRKDCADFVLHAILRLLYQFNEGVGLSQATKDRARQTVLGFKYWPDEPGRDSLCTWTENHQILYASGAYLAGQLYPDETFTNSGHRGREKMALNRGRILRWMDLRFRSGFSEWLSHVYYDEDLTALLSLVDFCQDGEIRRRASMIIDLLLLDMALNSQQGVFGSTHGRSYGNTKKWASNEGTTDTAKLLFGTGVFSSFDNMSAVAFALSENYHLPAVIVAIADDRQRPEMVNRQRMGLQLAEAERWGLGFEDFEDGMVWLSLEAYTHPRTVHLVLDMFDAFHWWDNAFFTPFKKYQRLLQVLRKSGLIGPVTRLFERDVCRNTREQVNLYTYRTPDYMLSCAQDYRPGYGGDQQHIWQATLGPNAVCFTTHPPKREGASPNYWTGSGNVPRAAQVENVVMVIYKLSHAPALYVPNRLFLTHAWLPRDQFDEVIERQGWVFARKGEGYLALRSQRPYHWQDEPGEDQGREILAPGDENIWLCELGRKTVDGDFQTFMARIVQAELKFEGLNVAYHSPSQGRLEFGWSRPLRQEGQIVKLGGYPRYDNPYVQADFPAEKLEVRLGKHWLILDWARGERGGD
jgi:hypothetical protein